jgi:hypothetical protein
MTDKATKQIINGMDAVDILNTGRGTVDENGVMTIKLDPDDNPLIAAARILETHVMLIVWEYAVSDSGRHEVEFFIRKARKP